MDGMNLGPEELRREIDEALAEIERVEAEVIELFDEVLGEQAAQRVMDYVRLQEETNRLAALKRARTQEPSTEPPATP